VCTLGILEACPSFVHADRLRLPAELSLKEKLEQLLHSDEGKAQLEGEDLGVGVKML